MLRQFYPIFAFALAPALAGQDRDVEDFRVEVTAGWWLRDTRGTIQSGIAPVDLRGDLDIAQNEPQFLGRLVFKPAARHRLIFEGTPYRLRGTADVTRQITFAGQQFTVRDRVTSSADMTYVFGGYQFDVVTGARGHLGFQGGVAYVDATGTITSETFGFAGTEIQSFPFPVAGAEFRALPLGSPLLQIGGGLKGMSLGDYGHYLEASLDAGIGIGRHITVLAGYRIVDADVHRRDRTRGFMPRFTGPVFSVQVRH